MIAELNCLDISNYPADYLRGIELYNAGKFWHAHEAWEEIWRNSQADLRLFYQALIQAAASLLHYQRNNPRGARLCMQNALTKFNNLPANYMSLDLINFTAKLTDYVADALIEDRAAKCINNQLPHPLIELLEVIAA